MNAVAECTVSEMILLAASGLEEQGQSPFSAEALIVASWQKFPQQFGLKGYSDQYPDSNKVLSSIMGEKGLARRGWLVKVGQKLYTVSKEGQRIARMRMSGEVAAPVEPALRKPTPAHERLLMRLLDSTAWDKYREGRRQEVNFADATRFWGLTENMTGPAIEEALVAFEGNLTGMRALVAKGTITLSTGRCVTPEDVKLLCEINDQSASRFSRHLSLLKNRSGRG